MNFDNENIRKIFPLFVTLFIIAFVVIIILVWIPRENDIKLLKFNNYTEQDVYEKYEKIYSDEVTQMITGNQYNKLYEHLSDEYIKANSITSDNIYQFLLSNGLISNTIKTGDYKAYTNGNKNIYIIDLTISGKVTKLNITEEKPYDYKISFGNITYEEKVENSKKREINGLEFDIKRTTKNDQKIEYNIKITNKNESGVELDLLNYNNLSLIKNDGKMTIGAIDNNDLFTLLQNSSIVINATFEIPQSEQAKIEYIRFSRVKINNKTEKIDVAI